MTTEITKLEHEYIKAVKAHGKDTQIAGFILMRLMRLYEARLDALCTR